MAVKGGRLEFLTPHFLRSQLLRPGFVSLSLRLGAARQMPSWAKLQFLNQGVSAPDLDRVLGRIVSLESWVDEWESLGREHEQGARDALVLGRTADASRRYLAAAAAYNFAQYVMFLSIDRKRALHDSCVRTYGQAAPLFDPPVEPFEVTFRRHRIEGYLRRPKTDGPVPVVVLFNGTNAVKEEMHWWAESLLARGIAVITFDGPGLGRTFYRLSMVAEPRPIGVAILNQIEAHPGLDPESIGFFGMSLGGYLAIRMATHDSRVKAVAAVSPPYSAEVYWNLTLAAMRRELAALYGIDEGEMGASVHRITLSDVIGGLRCPLLLSGGGNDLITPPEESWRIFEEARCEREMVFYPNGAHDCFNVLDDLRPRVVSWFTRHLEPHRLRRVAAGLNGHAPEWMAAEAVDPEFADALEGEATRPRWTSGAMPRVELPVRKRWPWRSNGNGHVVHRTAPPGPLVLSTPR